MHPCIKHLYRDGRRLLGGRPTACLKLWQLEVEVEVVVVKANMEEYSKYMIDDMVESDVSSESTIVEAPVSRKSLDRFSENNFLCTFNLRAVDSEWLVAKLEIEGY